MELKHCVICIQVLPTDQKTIPPNRKNVCSSVCAIIRNKMSRKKPGFIKPCKVCGEDYNKTGKYQKLCNKCIEGKNKGRQENKEYPDTYTKESFNYEKLRRTINRKV